MNGITLWMAFVDAIPVVIFLIACLTLMKYFRQGITGIDDVRGINNHAFMSAATFMLFGGAVLKVTWKTMYALNMCDYYTLAESFFPMQTIGFTLMGLSLIGYMMKDGEKANIARGIFVGCISMIFIIITVLFTGSAKADAVLEMNQVLPYESHMPFLLSTFVGMMVCEILLIALCIKKKNMIAALAFGVSTIFYVVQVFVGSTFDGSSNMHWIAQLITLAAQSGLLVGAMELDKKK